MSFVVRCSGFVSVLRARHSGPLLARRGCYVGVHLRQQATTAQWRVLHFTKARCRAFVQSSLLDGFSRRRTEVNLCPALRERAMQDSAEIARQLAELSLEHRDLDLMIARLANDPGIDQLALRRMKKRKLRLKDAIAQLQSRLIPDIDA